MINTENHTINSVFIPLKMVKSGWQDYLLAVGDPVVGPLTIKAVQASAWFFFLLLLRFESELSDYLLSVGDPPLETMPIKASLPSVLHIFFIQLFLSKLKQLHKKSSAKNCKAFIVGVRGFEPPTSTPPAWRANRATLHPEMKFWASIKLKYSFQNRRQI